VRKQFGIILLGLLIAMHASAAVPLILKVTERSFQITPGSKASQNETTLLEADPKILSDLIAKISLEERTAGSVTAQRATAKYKLYQTNAQSLQEKYSASLAEYFNQVAKKQKAKVKVDGQAKLYLLEDGIAFFRDFYKFEGQKDPVFRAVARAMLRGPYRLRSISDRVGALAADFHESSTAQTYLFSANDYTEQDMKMLTEIGRGGTYRYEKIGDTYVFGSGFSYLLTRKLVIEGKSQTDPVLQVRFNKILRYSESSQTPIIQNYNQSATAYFDPSNEVMSFVKAHNASLNAYTHEMTHSRFGKFTQRLDSWTQSRGYVVPFHIDGPMLEGQPHGGLFDLLDEVNSWRVGESFDRGTPDEGILEMLKQNYGPQAGFESVEMLDKVWTADKIKNKSIPYLVYSEIRNFNKLTNEQLIAMGREGNQQNDFVKKMNFLLMLQSGRFAGTASEVDATDVFVDMGKTKNSDSVTELYEKLATKMGLKVPDAVKAQNAPSIDLDKASLEQVLQEFTRKGSSESMGLLLSKFAKQLGPQHIEALVSRPEGVAVLASVLNLHKITAVMKFKNGAAVVRDPISSPWLTALDAAAVKYLYDGSASQKGIPLLNFISMATRPEEMPLTFGKTVELFNPKVPAYDPDVNIASYFLKPPSEAGGRSVLWGEQLIPQMGVSLGNPEILKVVVTFFKEATTPYLTQNLQYGNNTFVALNAKTREKTIQAISHLTPEQSDSLTYAGRILWHMAQSKDPGVRSATFYAMLSNPMYVLMNERNLIEAESSGNPMAKEVSEFLRESASGILTPQSVGVMSCQKVLLLAN
jgi:hypothetical protein